MLTEAKEEATTAVAVKSGSEKIGKKVEEITKHLVEGMGTPTWGLVPIIIALCLVILLICGFCIRKCFRKRRANDGKKGKGVVDIKSVQSLGSAYKPKVQPDMEELRENAEDQADDAESRHSEQKLGRLQYKLGYDFNSNSLTVTVTRAEELPALYMGGTSDPYVKVCLLPDKKKKFETKVLRKTLNPVFKETFTFKGVPYADAMNKTLIFAIFVPLDSLFSDLRNLGGTALMNFLAALFMTQLLYVIGVGGVQDAELCVGLSFALQYMRLSVFCWLLLMTHHMYRTFKDNMHLLPPVNPSIGPTFWKYSLFGWCSPLIFLLLSIFIQYKKTGNLLDVSNLKGTNCWFVDRDAFLFGYGVPMLVLLVVIISSLIRTAFVVRQSVSIQVDNKTREKMRRKRKLQLFLYVKLTAFISAVALLSAIYVLSKIEIFWILFNIFQGIQGIFIALCVTCNCNVLKIYTKSFRKRRKRFQYGGIPGDLSKSTSLQLLAWDPTPHSV